MLRTLASSCISHVGFCIDEMSSRCIGKDIAIRNAISLFFGLADRFAGERRLELVVETISDWESPRLISEHSLTEREDDG